MTPFDLTTNIVELPVTLHVTDAHRGSPGSFNPRDGGTPPEPAEVEFRVLLTKDGREPVDITEYLSDDVIEGLHDELIETLDDMLAGVEP
jgi:hypothetical protein